MVEHSPCKRVVAGSIPASGTRVHWGIRVDTFRAHERLGRVSGGFNALSFARSDRAQWTYQVEVRFLRVVTVAGQSKTGSRMGRGPRRLRVQPELLTFFIHDESWKLMSLQCYMCKFYGDDRQPKTGDTETCYGNPPVPLMKMQDGDGVQAIESHRPKVKWDDPRCSKFITHPRCLMVQERPSTREEMERRREVY